jgi:hypothetical protein
MSYLEYSSEDICTTDPDPSESVQVVKMLKLKIQTHGANKVFSRGRARFRGFLFCWQSRPRGFFPGCPRFGIPGVETISDDFYSGGRVRFRSFYSVGQSQIQRFSSWGQSQTRRFLIPGAYPDPEVSFIPGAEPDPEVSIPGAEPDLEVSFSGDRARPS